MTMSRRDTIVVAVLVNAALLCVLFLVATHEDQVPAADHFAALSLLEEVPMKIQIAPVRQSQSALPVDEVDQALASYISAEREPELEAPTQVAVAQPRGERSVVEVTVKRGDALEKIARANGTSVSELCRMNGLLNDKLSIGQVLKVPVRGVQQQDNPAVEGEANEEFYTLQVGDSPWLIAKKFQVRLDDLLRLNELDETKARNLKPGDKVRIR